MGAGVRRSSLRLGEDPRWDSVSFAQLAAATSSSSNLTTASPTLTTSKIQYTAFTTPKAPCDPRVNEFCEQTADVAPTQAEIDASRARADAAQEAMFPKSGSCPNGRRWTATEPCTDRDAFNPETAFGICPDGSRAMEGQPCRDGSRAVAVEVCYDGSSAYPGTCPTPPPDQGSGGNTTTDASTGTNKALLVAGAVGFGAILLFVLRRQRQAR